MQIKASKYRLIMVNKLLFHPFVQPDLTISLQNKKYSLVDMPRIEFGPRNYISGLIASKNDCLIETNTDRKLIAVEGPGHENVIEIMRELISISQEDFDIDLESDLEYVEFIVNCIVTTEKNPITSFKKFNSTAFDKFSKFFGHETTSFGIRLAPKDLPPTSRYWYDFQIQPRITKSDREYYVIGIYRSEHLDDVINFSQNINETVSNIIDTIEGD